MQSRKQSFKTIKDNYCTTFIAVLKAKKKKKSFEITSVNSKMLSCSGFFSRAWVRRSTDRWPPGCRWVGPGGRHCWRRSGRATSSELSVQWWSTTPVLLPTVSPHVLYACVSVSESGFSAADPKASPGLCTDCVTQPDPPALPLNSTRSPSADGTFPDTWG